MTVEQRLKRLEDHLGLSATAPDVMPTTKPRVAVCVGHSRIGDRGAVSIGGVSEWDYNDEVSEYLADELRTVGFSVLRLNQYDSSNYAEAIRLAAAAIKREDCDIAVELHFNAAGPTAQGFEYLYWESSVKGNRLAHCFLDEHQKIAGQFPNRGVKPKGSGDRGAHFLSWTHCASAILEPFFGSNQYEWDYWRSKKAALAHMYCRAIQAYFAA